MPLLLGCAGSHDSRVPSMEKLRSEDCEGAISAYRQLLELPLYAATVVTNRPPVKRNEAQQAQALLDFSGQCQERLVGSARRTIVRCWADAKDAETFRACNDRF